MKRILIPLGMIILLVTACVPSAEQINEILSAAEQTAVAQITFVPVTYTPNVATIVAKTMAAMTIQPLSTPTPGEGANSHLNHHADAGARFHQWEAVLSIRFHPAAASGCLRGGRL